ncbi:MAG: TAXI family TRAP transporter solute-binding subunit [Alphaproteobacteria bacterium]|nr:TAXI family TRAP transporter solute-binding subunit [Alphaproteobacteria bacterium]
MFAVRKLVAVSAGIAMFAAGAAVADNVKLPKQISWTAYGTTSTGYQQSVAIGNVLKNKFGTQLNIITGKNDVSRMLPLKKGKADFCACGIAVYFAQEGVLLFAKPSWGPQKVRTAMTAISGSGIGVALAKDTGVKAYKDLKGKRVAWVRGSPALNSNVKSFLAYGGLTWKDVKKVEFGGWKASIDGVINGQADAAVMSTTSPHAARLAASPRGIIWPQMNHKDMKSWDQLWKVGPWFQQHIATTGAGVSKEHPWIGAGYSYPILVSNDTQKTDLVYNLVKAINDGYPEFQNAAPGASGWSKKAQNFQWVMPFHDGSVKYWKEAGLWTADAQKHQDKLVKRQDVLASAWKKFKASNPPSGDDFTGAWMKARKAALDSAGLPVVFD